MILGDMIENITPAESKIRTILKKYPWERINSIPKHPRAYVMTKDQIGKFQNIIKSENTFPNIVAHWDRIDSGIDGITCIEIRVKNRRIPVYIKEV